MAPRSVLARLASVFAVSVLAAGCASDQPAEALALPAPRAATTVRHSAGSPLGAGDAPVEAGTAADALEVRVVFFALEKLPEEILGSLASQTRLTVDPGEDRPLLAAGSLAARGRAGAVAEPHAFPDGLAAKAGRVARFADLRGALPEGVTATFEVARDGDPRHACEPLHERFAVHVFRDTGPLDRAIEIAVDIEDTHENACAEGAPRRVRPARELSCLERRGPGAFAVIVRSPFHGDQAEALAALIEVKPAPDASCGAAHADTFAACAADLAREACFVKTRARPVLAPPPVVLAPGLAGLADGSTRRGALLALARAHHAPVAEELALAGSDELVALAARGISERAVGGGEPWLVERSAINVLRALASGDDAPPELTAIVTRRAGAATSGTFFAFAERARSLEHLERLLVAENLDLLEDASPALRVRALEWLRPRGLAPEGFDPLGPAAARRAALESLDVRAHLGEQR